MSEAPTDHAKFCCIVSFTIGYYKSRGKQPHFQFCSRKRRTSSLQTKDLSQDESHFTRLNSRLARVWLLTFDGIELLNFSQIYGKESCFHLQLQHHCSFTINSTVMVMYVTWTKFSTLLTKSFSVSNCFQC